MTLIAPGTCRHCKCAESNACRLENGEPCSWIDWSRTVCSNPPCMIAEKARLRKAAEQAREQRASAAGAPVRPRVPQRGCGHCAACCGRGPGRCHALIARHVGRPRKSKKRRAA